MKQTPMQQVREKFGSRDSLVEKLMPLLESKDTEMRSRLMSTSNKKLLRIHATAAIVKGKFASRKNLVEQITKLRYPKGNPDDGFQKRVNESSLKRLLDMYRQVGGK